MEKFIGDAVMAVFGIPRARDDDAERAVRAGLALVAAVEQLGPRLGLEEAALRLRVGVNTGEVVASMGSGPDDWRITGDTVNTSARFQTAAPPGGAFQLTPDPVYPWQVLVYFEIRGWHGVWRRKL